MNTFDYKACIPFTEDFIEISIGFTFVLSMLRQDGECESFSHVQFCKGGETIPSGKWEIIDGALCFNLDNFAERHFHMDCVSSINGSLFLGSTKANGSGRPTLHCLQKISDSQVKVGIAVASCHDYREFTLKKLIRSAKASGVSLDDMVVFVGGVPDEKDEESQYRGVKIVAHEWSARDYTPLVSLARNDELRSKFDMWLLIHDTCEFSENFYSQIGKLDIGMNYDVVFALNPHSKESSSSIGLYSSDYIKKSAELLETSVSTSNATIKHRNDFEKGLAMRSGIYCMANGAANAGTTNVRGKRDFYGTGTERHAVHLRDIGIIKNTTMWSSDRSKDRP